jgi:hypothetical protein
MEPVTTARTCAGACPGAAGRQRPAALGGAQAQADGVDTGDLAWGLLTPAHWHLGTEQVSLIDPLQLALDEPRRAPCSTPCCRFSPATATCCAGVRRCAGTPRTKAWPACHRVAGPRGGPQCGRLAGQRPRGAPRAAAAGRGADAAAHPPHQRTAPGARPAAGQLLLAQRLRCGAAVPPAQPRRWTSACVPRRWPTTGRPGSRPGTRWTPGRWPDAEPGRAARPAGAADAVRRKGQRHLGQRAPQPAGPCARCVETTGVWPLLESL